MDKKDLWGRCNRCHIKRPVREFLLVKMQFRCNWCRDVQ